MAQLDAHLKRLLKLAARAAKEKTVAEVPFGFDTRVVAQWRELKENDSGEVTRFIRRVALVAIAITVLGGVAAYQQINEDEELGEPLTNDYAIADSTIERQLLQ